MSAPLRTKFLRAFPITPAPQHSSDGCMLWIMRLVYEFWGFCINGSNSLSVPGGISTSHSSGSYISMPTGFESGSTVLLGSGTDGETSSGLPYFNVTGSTPFSASFAGKWLTMWKSGSTSTDDSIYKIAKWINSSSLMLDPTYGGTSISSSGSVPQFTTRTGINYRVVDYEAAANLTGYASGNYIVYQFNRASDVNPGQRKSQFKLGLRSGNTTISQLVVGLSPSGSWNGAIFAGESYPDITPDVDVSGFGTGGWGSGDWFHSSSGGEGSVNLIGGLDFLICQAGGAFMGSANNSFFCVEVPERLYSAAADPNPVCALNVGNRLITVAAQVGWGDSSRVMPSPYDTTQRRWAGLTRGFVGAHYPTTMYNDGSSTALNMNRWPFHHNQVLNHVILQDVMLSLPTINGQSAPVGQFTLARVRLRSVRFAGGFANLTRFDDNASGRWINVKSGMLWPWDHALVARKLFESA